MNIDYTNINGDLKCKIAFYVCGVLCVHSHLIARDRDLNTWLQAILLVIS